MNALHPAVVLVVTAAPAAAQDWYDSARYFPAVDTISTGQPGGHPGDFFTLGDHDGDGDVDLLLGELAAVGFSAIRVYRNEGAGDLVPLAPQAFPPGMNALLDTPEMLDLDGDGLGDLVVADGAGGIAVLRSAGDGTFLPPAAVAVAGDLADVEVMDATGDGVAELATLSDSGGSYVVRWWAWTGASFQGGPAAAFPSLLFGTGSLGLFDADADGDPDIAAKGQSEPVVRVFETVGSALVAGQELALPALGVQDAFLLGGDLEGDGDGDLLISWASFAEARFQPLVTEGGLLVPGTEWIAPVSPGEIGYRDPFLADWDGDGDLDLVSHAIGGVDFEDDRELFLVENVDNQFAEAARALTGRIGRGAGVADVNGDGNPDYVAPKSVQFGDGTLRGTHEELPFLTFSTNAIQAVDWEGDGDLDLWSDQGQILTNDAAAGFPSSTGETVFAWPDAPESFGYDDVGVIADLTGDGHPDMLAQYEFFPGAFVPPVFQEMRLLVDGGTGVFTDSGAGAPPGVLVTGGFDELARAVDMDQDGDLDVLGPSGLFGSGTYWENDGTGFLARSISLIPEPILDVADVDLDGDMDLLSTRYDSIAFEDHVIVHRATPAGFVEEILLTQPANFIFLRPRFLDLDDDGDLDVAAPEDFFNDLYLFEEVGGAYAAAGTLDNGFVDPTTLVADDVDGDGSTDLVTASLNGGNSTVTRTIQVYRRDGPGITYEAPRAYVGRNHEASADLDGDGDLDLYGASSVLSRRWHPPTGGQRVQIEPGFAGTDSIEPILGASGAFRVGESVAFHVVRGLGGAPLLLGAGLEQASFADLPFSGMTLHLGSTVLILSSSLDGTPGAPGQGTFDLPYVVGAGGVGVPFSMQVFCLDAGSPTLLSASNGLWFEYGP